MTTSPDTLSAAQDLAGQVAEARAEVARIDERILSGAPDVSAVDLIAAEAEVERLEAAHARQVELDQQAAQRAAAEQARIDAEDLADRLAEAITGNGGVPTHLATLEEAATEALAALRDAVADHEACIAGFVNEVAGLGRRIDLAPFGISEAQGPRGGRVVRLVGTGQLAPLDATAAVASVVATVLEHAPRANAEILNTFAAAAATGSNAHATNVAEMRVVPRPEETREQRIARQEAEAERYTRECHQEQLERKRRDLSEAATTASGPERADAEATLAAFDARHPDFVPGAAFHAGKVRSV